MTDPGSGQPGQGPLGFRVDTTRCINCKTCEIACKDVNGAAVGQRLRRVHTFEGGAYPDPFVCNLSMACNHCRQPQCLAACPAGAYRKRSEDGIVVHDPERCIGCRYCTWACPYAAPQYDAEAGRVMKCNLCLERLDAGGSPVCVEACPMRAIAVRREGDPDEPWTGTMAIRNLPSPGLSEPTSRYRIKGNMQVD